jgi:hypothetical protein
MTSNCIAIRNYLLVGYVRPGQMKWNGEDLDVRWSNGNIDGLD